MTQAAHESLGTRTDLFIGGEWRAGSTGDSIEVLDPGTGRPVAVVAVGLARRRGRSGVGGRRRPARMGRPPAP